MNYAEEYCREYLEKIFYFCLRKTGNEHDAGDLAGEISCEILASLSRGQDPEHFSAWVWKIARNRYAKWAKRKFYAKDAGAADLDALENILPDDCDVEGNLILKDDLRLMRRELAFIRSDYRCILIAHYFEEKSVSAIAQEFLLPIGTVKTKLQSSRKKLKEGMQMARDFGKRSYNPEEISFTNNCSAFGDRGQPWSILEHLLYKNIFLEVYDNPETAEELSLELGVALPYMESELAFLTRETFLAEKDGKFETTFPIISAEAQKKVYDNNTAVTPELTALLEALIEKYSAACEKIGAAYYGTYQSYEDAKWTLLMRALDNICWDMSGVRQFSYTERPDNGCWDIVGYQYAELMHPNFVGQHGYVGAERLNSPIHFQQYKYYCNGIAEKTPDFLEAEDVAALKQVLDGKSDGCDSASLDKLEQYGYIRREGGEYVPTILIFAESNGDAYFAQFSDAEKKEISEIADRIRQILKKLSDVNTAVIFNDLPRRIQANDRMCEIAGGQNNVGLERGFVLDQALRDGWLKYTDATAPTIGAYICK